jgi:hypothetical protein
MAPWAFAGALALCGGAAWAAPADDLQRLLEEGRSTEAYELGRRHPEELGRPDFDFYYGVAAIDSGHAGEGVLALERYIVRYPANDRARLELARGYFVLGELVRAREEFDRVASHNPPPDVQATIDRFVDSIRAQESRYRSTTLAYVEAGGGYDTNVNSGVRDPFIGVPSLGTVQLAAAGVETDSPFALLGAGVRGSRPLAPGVALLGGAALETKLHSASEARAFDQTELAAYGGASWLRHKDLFRATASLSVLSVDDTRFRQSFALGGEWHRQLDELNTASLFAQYARLEYPSSEVRNADFFGLGAGWRRAFVARLQPVLELQALLGREQNDASPVRDDLSRDLYTLRGAMAFTPAPRWGASLGLSYAASRFLETDPLFGVKREDDYYGLELGASYRLSRQASLRADYQHLENHSSIALYEYDRDFVTLRLRYEFQ